MNTSGIKPVEYKVLVLPDDIDETDETMRRAKAAGLEIVQNIKEREQMAQIKGTLVAVGGNAFEDWKGEKPESGQRVMIAKYAGLVAKGDDGKDYRLCNDKDIAAMLEVVQ